MTEGQDIRQAIRTLPATLGRLLGPNRPVRAQPPGPLARGDNPLAHPEVGTRWTARRRHRQPSRIGICAPLAAHSLFSPRILTMRLESRRSSKDRRRHGWRCQRSAGRTSKRSKQSEPRAQASAPHFPSRRRRRIPFSRSGNRGTDDGILGNPGLLDNRRSDCGTCGTNSEHRGASPPRMHSWDVRLELLTERATPQ